MARSQNSHKSFQVREDCIEKVKEALKRADFPDNPENMRYGQVAVVEKLGIARATVSNYFRGIPVNVENFKGICNCIGVDWEEIIPNPSSKGSKSVKNEFYIERDLHDKACYEEVNHTPGALVRIKAPEKFGKTWFLENLVHQVRELKYRYLVFNFLLADNETFSDIHKFSRLFCSGISRELMLTNKLDEYWNESFDCLYNTTEYFQEYLLEQGTSPLVLILKNVDKVFEHPIIANDFCKLLRGWHERANSGDRTSGSWQKLRLVIAHSTDVYGSLDINCSPLAGVGKTIELPELTEVQVQDLAKHYELDWSIAQVKRIMECVGGHPYLVDLALENISSNSINLEKLLLEATQKGIYMEYLDKLLGQILEHPELATALKKVVTASQPVRLEQAQVFKLYGMGLILKEGHYATPRCQLYRQYFSDRLDNEEI